MSVGGTGRSGSSGHTGGSRGSSGHTGGTRGGSGHTSGTHGRGGTHGGRSAGHTGGHRGGTQAGSAHRGGTHGKGGAHHGGTHRGGAHHGGATHGAHHPNAQRANRNRNVAANVTPREVQRIAQYRNEILAASQRYGVRPGLIAAVISRETHGRNILGDNGHGHGLMQVDDRSWGGWLGRNNNGLTPASNIMQGASILHDSIRQLGEVNGIAAYNAGAGRVSRAVAHGRSPDSVTTDRNYSADVRAREGYFRDTFR